MNQQTSYQPSVTRRRAQFVYDAARFAAIAARAPVIPLPWEERELDFRAQFLEVIRRQCGPYRKTDAAALHEDWVQAYLKNGWQYGPVYDRDKRTHPDIVPYDQLGGLERDKDDVFIALCEIARLYIYE